MANNNNKIYVLCFTLFVLGVMTTTMVSAQAPPLQDPNIVGAKICTVDSDCDSGSFCRAGYCGAYVLEDDWCGGFLPPQDERRCAPGLKCTDYPTDPQLSGDGNGYCRRLCSSTADCDNDDYCAEDGVCRASGSCAVRKDCFNADNAWAKPACLLGTVSCDSGSCSVTCHNLSLHKPIVHSTISSSSTSPSTVQSNNQQEESTLQVVNENIHKEHSRPRATM